MVALKRPALVAGAMLAGVGVALGAFRSWRENYRRGKLHEGTDLIEQRDEEMVQSDPGTTAPPAEVVEHAPDPRAMPGGETDSARTGKAPTGAGLYALAAALLVAAAFFMFAPIEFAWSVRLLDSVVITAALAALLTLSALAVMLASRGRPLARKIEPVLGRFDPMTIVTGVAAVLALFAAYGSFRNQTRLVSEGQLNSEAMILYQLEMQRPGLRCLYDNYGFPEYDACLARITANDENWSLAIFYVEEAWFVLLQSYEDRQNWGSTYVELIDFWRDDVGKDPTGLFTYYQVAGTKRHLSNEARLVEAQQEMDRAGVFIARNEICKRYQKVRQALELANGQSDDRNVCGSLGLPAQARARR